jgi:hypothetical protein
MNLFVLRQSEAGSGLRDPSWFQNPAYQGLIWHDQRESNPAIALKVIFFAFSLSRNWNSESLRPFHFLPTARATTLASTRATTTRED